MTKSTAKVYVVVIAESSVSNKWLFVRNRDGEWALPYAKQGMLDTHPIVRAVKSAIGVFDDITNIEIWFELDGSCVAKIYKTVFDFEKEIENGVWHNPVSMMCDSKVDPFTKSIIETMIEATQRMKGRVGTKSNPLEITIPPRK